MLESEASLLRISHIKLQLITQFDVDEAALLCANLLKGIIQNVADVA